MLWSRICSIRKNKSWWCKNCCTRGNWRIFRKYTKEWIKEKSLLSNENPSIRPYEEVMDKIKEKLFEKTASSISKFSANKTNVNQDKKSTAYLP